MEVVAVFVFVYGNVSHANDFFNTLLKKTKGASVVSARKAL